jgi:hypothetical protein
VDYVLGKKLNLELYKKQYDPTGISIPPMAITYTHTLHGSVGLLQRQLDVEQVRHKYTQFLQCKILLSFQNSIIHYIYE